MRASTALVLMAMVILTAGCATLRYEGMPRKNEPHAMAVERGGVEFVSIDGRPVTRPAFSVGKLRLVPGYHEILARYSWKRTDSDYSGDVDIRITVHYWSRFAQGVAFDAVEGNRYEIAAEANLPSTEVSYSTWQRDNDSTDDGRVSIKIEHELTEPDDWRPIIARILPIKKYWRTRALPTAEIKGEARPVDEKAPPQGE